MKYSVALKAVRGNFEGASQYSYARIVKKGEGGIQSYMYDERFDYIINSHLDESYV